MTDDDNEHAMAATATQQADGHWVVIVSSCHHLGPEHVARVARLLRDALADVERDADAALARRN